MPRCSTSTGRSTRRSAAGTGGPARGRAPPGPPPRSDSRTNRGPARLTITLSDRRRFYAEEIEAVAGLRTSALVEALATVPREAFLPRGPWKIAVADPARL